MENLNKEQFLGIWDYYLCLENDLSNTSRFIEPSGQEEVHSFEFAKILILASTEAENLMKIICFELTGEEKKDIGEYKKIILQSFPRIVFSEVSVRRLNKKIFPFSGWDTGKLIWWESYNSVKHNRGAGYKKANYINAVTAVAAAYILIFYLASICKYQFDDTSNEYISSEYSHKTIACAPPQNLPDYDNDDLGSGKRKLYRKA